MKTAQVFLASFIPLLVLPAARAQQTSTQNNSMPGMQMSVPAATPPAEVLPEIGSQGQGIPGPVYQLADLEASALQHNPTLVQADAEVGVAKGHAQQSGLWPNPTVGYFGDEIAGGIGNNGGRHGGYIEQTILLGRKLYLAQQVAGADVRIATLQKEEQHYRVQNAIRAAYFQTMAAQEMLSLATARVAVAAKVLDTAQRLQNTGARDASEVAMAEIELERAKLAVELQQAHLQQEWENLRSVVSDPALAIGHLAGKLDAELPQLDTRQLTDALLSESPAIKIARENTARAQNSVAAARRQSVPDLQLKAGLEENFEENDLTGRPFGLQGVAEARIELPIFNRDQGNVAAARADLERSQAESRRVELQLRQQAATVVEEYQAARTTVERYRDEILPHTRSLYEMQLNAWGRMALSYPQVLLAEQSLFTAQAEYLDALQHLRTNAVTLSGFLLSDGLASPMAGSK